MHWMKNVQYGAFVCAAMIFTDPYKTRLTHSNSAWHSVLFCETWRSHTGVDEDYALSTGEGLQTFWWNIVPSYWAFGPEDEGNLTSWQGEMSQMTWIFTNTIVRISQPPTVVPKRQQETTNGRCVKSQKSMTKHLWTNLHFDVRNKFLIVVFPCISISTNSFLSNKCTLY
jgi:hypothetical protein